MTPSRWSSAPSSITEARPSWTPVTTYRPRTRVVPMPGGAALMTDASGGDGSRLGDAAPDRPALDAPPEDLEALGQRATVGRGQPESHEQPVAARLSRVLVGGAAVVDDVVVQELDVAGPELHLIAELVADLGQEIERLVLRGGEARDRGDLLRRLHEGAGVLRGELALAHREDRHRVAGRLAARLLAFATADVVGAEQRVQIGPARQDRVAHRGHAHHAARAPAAGGAHAEQADHVAAIGVPAQRAARARLGTRGDALALGHRGLDHLAVEPHLVANQADELAVGVLVDRGAQVTAEPPPDRAQLLVGVALNRQAAQQHEPAAPLEIPVDLGQLGRHARQREVRLADVRPREAAALHLPQRGVDLVDRGGRQSPDPVARAGQLLAVPDHGALDGPIVERAGHGPQG